MNAKFTNFSINKKVVLGWVIKINLQEEEYWNHHVNHYKFFHLIILFITISNLILRNFSCLYKAKQSFVP